MNRLAVRPLTREAFARFGEVICCDGASHYPINGGTTERYDRLADVQLLGANARAIISIFRAQPREFPFAITLMERHPFGSQAFMPLQLDPYLVVVAEPGPDDGPGELLAFLAQGNQGVNYRAGIWHHPLIAVGRAGDFLVVDRRGDGNNCDEVAVRPAWELRLPD